MQGSTSNGENSDTNEAEEVTILHPPSSCGEQFRDGILRTLDRPFFQVLGIIVILLVVVDGAFFFFLLVGWQSMCRPRTDCQPRNWWYNFSIQVLNVLFTYMGIMSMPWRSTNFLHIAGWSCPRRENAPGHDLYGIPVSNDTWFHIPLGRRMGITIVLLLNCLTQFANQATRIKYYSFELQNVPPGNIWTNVFFAASFLFAGIGGAWMGYEVFLLRKEHPGKFGPGPLELAQSFYEESMGKGKKNENDADENNGANENDDQIGNDDDEAPRGESSADENKLLVSGATIPPDPTREPRRRSVVNVERSSMRMWAM